MKEIKSKKYLSLLKNAQKNLPSSLPGDSALPPGVTEKMIADTSGDSLEDRSKYGQEGYSELVVDWKAFAQWFEYEDGMNDLSENTQISRGYPSEGSSIVELNYTYDFIDDQMGFHSENINPISGKIDKNQSITDKNLLDGLVDYFEDQIKEDIIEIEAQI